MNPSSRSPCPPARIAAPAALFLCLFLTGCAGFWGEHRQHEASSVVQFLYPTKEQPFIEPQIPTLRLPLRVGVAFIPAGVPGTNGGYYPAAAAQFTEQQKVDLLEKVAAQFKTLPFVQSIEIVPTTYLRPGGSFENLDQLRSMLGIDVIALVAYDQAQVSRGTEAAIAYWTIVGAYIVPAQRNSTHTLMEAAVYDIASRSLLFRAPGTSVVQGDATLFRNESELRGDSARGLADASAQMTTNLAAELEKFKVRAREEPDRVRIEHKPGYSGGGALDGPVALAVLGLLGFGAWRRRQSSFARVLETNPPGPVTGSRREGSGVTPNDRMDTQT
jgi:rhombotail lipoprotein